jgi:hypothetical protein
MCYNNTMKTNPYTLSERTVRKYTVGQAVESAKRMLKGVKMNVTSIHSRELTEKITLEELNKISEQLYIDSVDY